MSFPSEAKPPFLGRRSHGMEYHSMCEGDLPSRPFRAFLITDHLITDYPPVLRSPSNQLSHDLTV